MDRKGIPSVNRLCQIAQLGPPTVLGIIHGTVKKPTDETLMKLARALEVDPKVIYGLVEWPVEHAEEYEPPAEAARLSPRQRDAVTELIKAMVEVPKEETPSNVHTLYPGVEEEHPEHPSNAQAYAADSHHGPTEGQLMWDTFDGYEGDPR